MEPELTVVTGTRHRPESFKRFYDSAVKAMTIPTEIIIADASDNPPPHGIMQRDDTHLLRRVEHYPEIPRLNPNRGYDQLCRKATTKYVAFFNDDCELVHGWDRIAVDFMNRFAEVGIGCLYWHDPGGQPYLQTHHGVIYPNFGIIRKAYADQWGWFETRSVYIPELEREESLSFYGNDVGLALKCVDAGFACVPVPGTLVHHHREQDDERRQNMEKHLHDDRRMPPGSLPGTILRRLWNGDDATLPGDEMLRQKARKFSYLCGVIDSEGNVRG